MISVIIPVYNSKDYLSECIDSLLRQVYRDFEIILIDDGSTDGSSALCDELAQRTAICTLQPEIKVLHQKNAGVSSARNAGLAIAKGEYICFVDSDDCVDREYLLSFIKAKSLYPESDNIFCFCNNFRDGDMDAQIKSKSGDPEYLIYYRKDYMKLASKMLVQAPTNKLYRTEIIKENEIKFEESISLGEDLLFYLDYLDASNSDKIIVINKELYNYRIHGNETLDRKYRADLLEIYRKLNRKIEYYLKKWEINGEAWQDFYNKVFFDYEKVLFNTYRSENKQSEKGKLAYNNQLLQSEEFKESMRKINCSLHPLYRISYRSGNYKMVLFLNKLVHFKNSIKRR